MSAPTLRQLAAVDILAGLSENDLAEIGRRMRHRRWPAGHPFVGHRDESRDVYFVLDGKVRVTIYSESGREVSFRDLEAGSTFGELAAIDQGPRSANVVAVTNVQVGSVTAP